MENTTTKAATVDNALIRDMMRNAEAHEDEDLVTLCLLALQGNAGARREITAMLSEGV